MPLAVNIPSQIVVQTAAQWAADATVYSAKRILVTSDAFYGSTDQRKFKIADGVQTWANLDYMPIDIALALTLAQVLANGNSVGGSGIESTNGANILELANTYFAIVGDSNSYLKSWIYGDDTTNSLGWDNAGYAVGDVSGIPLTGTWIFVDEANGVFKIVGSNYTASQILELDASKNIISAAKGTAYNKDFGTGTTNVPQIGSTLGNSQVVYTDASGRLITKAFGEFVINQSTSFFNPADSTTYYFGIPAGAPPTVAGAKIFTVPVNCKVTKVVLKLEIAGSVGTNENATYGIRINGVNTDITTTYQVNSAARNDIFSGLSINLTSGDNIEFYLTTPAYVTNPTNVNIAPYIYCEPQ